MNKEKITTWITYITLLLSIANLVILVIKW